MQRAVRLMLLIGVMRLSASSMLEYARTSQEKGLHEQALEYYRQILLDNSFDADMRHAASKELIKLGQDFFNQHQSSFALRAFDALVAWQDALPAIHHYRGFSLADHFGLHTQAIDAFQRALLYAPDDAEIHFSLSLSYLASGNFIPGWAEMEWRYKLPTRSPRKYMYPLPRQWQGESVIGKTIFLRCEQGHGDTFQFLRYAQVLYHMGARVVVEVQPALVQLISLCAYVHQVVPQDTEWQDFDYQIPLMSMPHQMKTDIHTIPWREPYIFAHPQLVDYWRNKLAFDTGFKIGICWHGDPSHSEYKFMPLHYFMRLAQVPGVTLYCLQRRDGMNQLEELPDNAPIRFFDAQFDALHGRFMDTAAVLKNLDLCITVDTSIAHLSGALGVPTWVVLPFPAEWRWLQEGDNSLWYPTVRLFRQREYGNWESVIAEIIALVHHTCIVQGKAQ